MPLAYQMSEPSVHSHRLGIDIGLDRDRGDEYRCILMGFGYGVMQPVIYDQTTRVASPEKTTLALAFVMSMNYLAILLAPPFIDALSSIFHIHSQQFAFVLNLCITLLAVVWSYVGRRTFLFNDSVDNDKTVEAL